jgi:hypothetical protein
VALHEPWRAPGHRPAPHRLSDLIVATTVIVILTAFIVETVTRWFALRP